MLYLNGRFISRWDELKQIITKLLQNPDNQKNAQEEILAYVRDGLIYEWMQERKISDSENFEPGLFVKMTDSQVKKHLMHAVGNHVAAANINLSEYLDIILSYSVKDEEGNKKITPIENKGNIPVRSDVAIHIDFKVRKAANEEFTVRIFGRDFSGVATPLGNLKIDTRKNGATIPCKMTFGVIQKYHNIVLYADREEILSVIRITPDACILEITSTLWPKESSKIRAILANERLVDMGTSVLWCTHNLGAESEHDPGEYYRWGNWTLDGSLSKLGPGYRAPSRDEWEELIKVCENKHEIVEINGRKFAKFTSSKTHNELLLPYLGLKFSDTVCPNYDYIWYWSSTPKSLDKAYLMAGKRSSHITMENDKSCGYPVRPVLDPNFQGK